jgi:antitoxin ParD1/3/4
MYWRVRDLNANGQDGEIMNLSLKPDLEKYINEQVKAGRFASAEEAVNAAVAHLQAEAELSTAADLDDLRADVRAGIEQADRGEFAEFTAEDVIAERRAALAAKKKVS